jgi:acylglycerol lipase
MKHTTFTWSSSGVEHFAQGWEAATAPRAVLAVVHGLGEHSGRYQRLAEFLAPEGIALMAMDVYGHGKTGGKRGGFPGYERILDSISEFLAQVQERYPSIPFFLMGHSMGGNLVANYLLKRAPKPRGAILSAPWLRLAFAPPKLDVTLAKIMVGIYPAFTQANKLDTSALSRDAAEVEKYNNDPLVHSKIGPPLFLEVSQAGEWALANAEHLALPTLLMHGDADRITSFEASKAFAEAAAQEVSWKPMEGYFHEMHNEPLAEREVAMGTIRDWLMQQLG